MVLPTAKNGSMNYRSNLLHFAGLYGTIEEYVKAGHDIHMKTTPFWRLYRAYRDKLVTTEHFSALDNDIKMIIEQYDKDQGCFVFGDIKGVVTANDIADIFGIPNEGRNLEYTAAIAECLNKSLVHASKPHLVTGCVPALLFWFGGKTRLLTPIIGRENKLPNFVRWSLFQLHKTLINMDLKTLEAYDEDDALPETQVEFQADDLIKEDEVAKDIVVVAHSNVPISPIEPILRTPTSKSMENNIEKNMCSVKTGSDQFEAPTWDIIPSQFKSPLKIFGQVHYNDMDGKENIDQLHAEKEILKKELDAMNVRREQAEVEAILLSEALAATETKLEEARKQINVLLEEVDKKKQPSPKIASIIKGVKRRQVRKVLRKADFEYANTKKRSGKKRKNVEQKSSGAVESMRKVGDVPYENAKKGKKMKQIGCRSPHDSIKQEIDCDTYVSKKVARKCREKNIVLSETFVGPMFDEDDYERLQNFLNTDYSGIALWLGKTAQIMQEDVEFLITNNGITGQTIDAYAEVLSRRLASDKKLKHKSYFMTILVSEYHKMNDISKLQKMEDIMTFLRHHKKGAKSALRSGKINKRVVIRTNTISDSMNQPLSNDERATLKILNGMDLDIPMQRTLHSPQQESGSLDCGVAVINIMESMASGIPVLGHFEDDDMKEMRATIVSSLLNDEFNWSQQ
ncbi:hypothetical protein ACFX2B_007786 [Malus domestica]